MRLKAFLVLFFLNFFQTSYAQGFGVLPSLLGGGGACYPLSASLTPGSGNIVAYWKLDGSGSPATGAISSNIGPAGTVINANGTGLAYVTGRIGQGLTFDGVDDAIYLATSSTTVNTVTEGNYSIMAWVNPIANASGGGYAVVGKYGFHGGIFYNWVGGTTNTFTSSLYTSANASVAASTTSIFPPGKWYQVVAVIDQTNGTNKIYVNGKLRGTTNFTAGTALRTYTGPFAIGAVWLNSSTIGRYNNASIDEVAVWNTALTAAQVDSLYYQQSCGLN